MQTRCVKWILSVRDRHISVDCCSGNVSRENRWVMKEETLNWKGIKTGKTVIHAPVTFCYCKRTKREEKIKNREQIDTERYCDRYIVYYIFIYCELVPHRVPIIYINISGSVRDIIVTMVGNEHGDTSINSDETVYINHSVYTLWKGINQIILHPTLGI